MNSSWVVWWCNVFSSLLGSGIDILKACDFMLLKLLAPFEILGFRRFQTKQFWGLHERSSSCAGRVPTLKKQPKIVKQSAFQELQSFPVAAVWTKNEVVTPAGLRTMNWSERAYCVFTVGLQGPVIQPCIKSAIHVAYLTRLNWTCPVGWFQHKNVYCGLSASLFNSGSEFKFFCGRCIMGRSCRIFTGLLDELYHLFLQTMPSFKI